MDSVLFKAILAMDAYNRGYDAGIEFKLKDGDNYIDNSDTIYTDAFGTHYIHLGNAAISATRGQSDAEAISFYGLAYSYNSETIISFRGTDDLTLLQADTYHGWPLGDGNTDSRGGPRNSDSLLRWNPTLKTEGNYGYDKEKKSQPCVQSEGRVRGFAGGENAVGAIGAIRGSCEPDQHVEEAVIEGIA